MALDGDARAKTLLDTAILLDGREQHLLAFLEPRNDMRAEVPNAADDSVVVPPPVPMPPDAHVPGEKGNPQQDRPLPESEIPSLPPLPDATGAAMNGQRLPAPLFD